MARRLFAARQGPCVLSTFFLRLLNQPTRPLCSLTHQTRFADTRAILPPAPGYFAPPQHHVFTRSRDGRAHQEGAHPLPILLRMVSRLDAMPTQLLTQTAPTFCSPAKTSLRTSSCSRVAHAPSPKRRPPPASCATTSPRRSELRLV